MAEELFMQLFNLFKTYDNDLTEYYKNVNGFLEFNTSVEKKMLDEDKQMLADIIKILGGNYVSKLKKLFKLYNDFIKTGKGILKIKDQQGGMNIIQLSSLIGGEGEKSNVSDMLQKFAKSQFAKDMTSKAKEIAIKKATDGVQRLEKGESIKDIGRSMLGDIGGLAEVKNAMGSINTLTKMNSDEISDLIEKQLSKEKVKKLIEHLHKPVLMKLDDMNKTLLEIKKELQK